MRRITSSGLAEAAFSRPTMRPCRSTQMVSTREKTCRRLWLTIRTAMPRSLSPRLISSTRADRRLTRALLPAEPDPPLVSPERAAQHLYQRGLAGSVVADKGCTLARLELQADPLKGCHPAEALGDSLSPQQRGHGLPPAPLP